MHGRASEMGERERATTRPASERERATYSRKPSPTTIAPVATLPAMLAILPYLTNHSAHVTQRYYRYRSDATRPSPP